MHIHGVIPFRVRMTEEEVQRVSNFAQFLPLSWLLWQRPLRYRKKKVGLIICNSTPTIWCKDCENRSSRYWDSFAHSKKT